MRGCFVTGTDTGVGKSVLTAAIAAALTAAGERVAAFKPVITGTDEEPDPLWPPDDELLAAAAGGDAGAIAPLRFGPPVSPHFAAELASRPIDLAELAAVAQAAGAAADVLVVEGVGGLLVPLDPPRTIRDFAVALGLPLIVAARPGLGTINHTLLTLEAARAAGLHVAGVVFTPWPARASAMQDNNRLTIAKLGAVDVATLPTFTRADPALLAAAGAKLPLARWLG